MLAIALLPEGKDRKTAAETCGMDRQTLRDWAHRASESSRRAHVCSLEGSSITGMLQIECVTFLERMNEIPHMDIFAGNTHSATMSTASPSGPDLERCDSVMITMRREVFFFRELLFDRDTEQTGAEPRRMRGDNREDREPRCQS